MNGLKRQALSSPAALLLLLVATHAWANENKANEASAPETDLIVEATVLALVDSGVVRENAVTALKKRIRARLGKKRGDRQAARLCASEEDAQTCSQRIRKEIKKCVETAQETDAIETPRDAEELAEAVIVAADDAPESLEDAGEMVRQQLRKGWKADETLDAAKNLDQSTRKPRWRQQARKLLRECAAADSCDAKGAAAALRVMARQSKRADADPRRTRRVIKEGLSNNRRRHAKSTTGDVRDVQQRLQRRVQKRRRGAIAEFETAAARARRRHRYRNRVRQETSQGGNFGGGNQGSGQRNQYRGGNGGQGNGTGGGDSSGGGHGNGSGGGHGNGSGGSGSSSGGGGGASGSGGGGGN